MRTRRRTLVAATIALLSPLVLGSVGLRTNLDQRVLAAHNRERAALGVPDLAWNEDLARDAAGWAAHLAQTGAFEHSPDDPDDPHPQGENLWAGTRDYYGPETMVGGWIAEKADFKPGVFPNVSRTGDWDDVGHYTQVAWRSTGQVGCALARGAQEDVLVCRYAEGGNVDGERPF